MGRRPSGFTLLEVLAVVLLTTVVMGVTLNHYVNLSRASQRATDHTRDVRLAASILDRIARDLEGAILVRKPEDLDPLYHPWIFYAESRISEAGADQLKFVTRGHRPRTSDAHESDLELVAYALRRGEDEKLELMRWSSPQLPEELDREIPRDEADGAVVLTDELKHFGMNFIDDAGETTRDWDSSTLVESSELPAAVEIELAFVDVTRAITPIIYRRTVVLPVRPLDFGELLDPASLVSGGLGGEDESGQEQDDQRCEDSPCAGMTACEAIGCSTKLGRYGSSLDQLLKVMMDTHMGFCTFKMRNRSLRWLIENPECR